MTIVDTASGTNVHEIAPGIHRISVPVPPSAMPGGFTFNQFLLADDEPFLFHTGPRKMFPLVRRAVEHVLGDVKKLRYVGFSHVEADECGSLNDWLEIAPHAEPVCSDVAVMLEFEDFSSRPPRGMADGAELSLGKKRLRFLHTPNLPHNWECGYFFETTTKTLLCGDLFTHGGADGPPATESELVGPTIAFHANMPPGAIAYARNTRELISKLAATEPTTLALMHGSSFRGDGAKLLFALADALGA